MNKWISILIITILVVGIIVSGYFLWQQTGELGEAESEIGALEGNITTLEGDVLTLEGNMSALETDIGESEATVSTLEEKIGIANSTITELHSDVSTQQTINSSLSAELKKVKDPRHFSSLTELTDWLNEDDTDIKYAGSRYLNMCYILQVKALRDGYLLPVTTYLEGGTLYVANRAIIGGIIYVVYADEDYMYELTTIKTVPSHPLPLD